MALFSMLFFAAIVSEKSFLTNPINLQGNPSPIPTTAAAVDTPYTGSGDSQEVRVYSTMTNESRINNGSFPIDSPSANARLSSAELNYTFAANYTTLHQVTPYSALDYPRVLNGTYLSNTRLADEINPSSYAGNFTTGQWANWDWGHDNDITTYSNYSSNATNKIRFEVYSNFSNLFIDDWVFPGAGALWFNQSMCTGMDLNFTANVNGIGVTSVDYKVEAEDWNTHQFQTFGTGQVTIYTSTLRATIYNPGTQFINATQGSHFRVTLTNSIPFNLTLYEANATVKVVQELEISDSKQIALGFDLLGNATVNGFQLLIRTIGDPTGVQLNAGIYRANWTFPTEVSWSMSPAAHPVGGPLATLSTLPGKILNGIITFNFSSPVFCNISNYFIVLNTSSSTVYYRIATVPNTAGTLHGSSSFPNFIDIEPDDFYKSPKVRHIVLNSSLGYGENFWNQSYLNQEARAYNLNAAPFAINVSRGWMPTDVNMSLQNEILTDADDVFAHEFPYTNTPGWYWGRGFWKHDIPSPIVNNGWRFDVPLAWNQFQSQSISFNVTFYAISYAVEIGISNFNVTDSQNPRWIINHTIAANTYQNWTFNSLAFVYPKSWNQDSALIINPFYTAIDTVNSEVNNSHYQQTATNNTGIKGQFGLYSFQIESYNAILAVQSFLNWNNTDYWPTNAFMRTDNVSIEFAAQISNIPVRNGEANTTLFDPNGNRVDAIQWTLKTEIYDQIKDGLTYYRFGRANLFNTTVTTPYGEYTAVSKWSNKTEVGFKHFKIYITNYTPQIQNVRFDREFGYNFVEGSSGQDVKRSNPFDLIVTTVNETTGLSSNFLPLENITTGSESNIFEYIRFKYMNINETVFQRGELFEVNISVQNLYAVADIDVQVKFELYYYSKPDWRILEATSDVLTLHQWGQPGYDAMINMTEVFPASSAMGLNCPIRKGPISMRLTFLVNDREVGSWSPRSPFIQVDGTDSSFEGQIMTNYILQNLDSNSFQNPINRTVGCNLPGVTHYFVSIMDAYGVSTETNSSKVVYGKSLALFENISPLPQIPTVNKLFNLSGNLLSENPNLILSGKQVKFEFLNQITHVWNDFNGVDTLPTITTDSQGHFTKAFNASIFGLDNLIRVVYTGDDDHLNATLNYSLTVIQYSHLIQVLVDESLKVTGNRDNHVAFWFFNSGNSTLENIQISVVCQEGYLTQVIEADYIQEKSLSSGEVVIRAYLVRIPPLTSDSNATFTFTITATVKETLQQVSFAKTVKVGVLQGTFLTLPLESIPALIFFLIAGITWISTIVFLMRKWRASKAEPGAPRRRFVKLGPKPQVPPEKVTEIPLEKKPVSEKPAAKDFDEILKEVKKDEEDNSS